MSADISPWRVLSPAPRAFESFLLSSGKAIRVSPTCFPEKETTLPVPAHPQSPEGGLGSDASVGGCVCLARADLELRAKGQASALALTQEETGFPGRGWEILLVPTGNLSWGRGPARASTELRTALEPSQAHLGDYHLLFLPAQGADGIRGLKGTKGEKVSDCPFLLCWAHHTQKGRVGAAASLCSRSRAPTQTRLDTELGQLTGSQVVPVLRSI